MKSALLLSGGIDSIAICHWLRPDIALTIDYGQYPAAGEIRAARAICSALNIRHEVLHIDARALGSGDLAGAPAARHARAADWWPYRNQFLITTAVMWLARDPVERLLIGSVKTDSTHLDGSQNFIAAMRRVLLAQEGQISLEAPGLKMTTPELIRASKIPISLLAYSHSCHAADYACGTCRGCNKRNDVMAEIAEDVL